MSHFIHKFWRGKWKKTCVFTHKWLDHLLLMTSYLITIVTDHRLSCVNELFLKTSEWGGGGGWQHHVHLSHLVRPRVNLYRDFNLIPTAWKNPSWGPLLVTSQASSSATTHKIYLFLRRSLRPSAEGKIVWKCCNISETLGRAPSTTPLHPYATVGVGICVFTE